MKKIKLRGLVIRQEDAGESDKRLTLLCKGVGRVSVYARGARRPKSKFIATCQLFAYADFVVVQGRGFYSLAEATLISNFFDVADYERLQVASAIVEICEKSLWDSENVDPILLLALRSLDRMAKGRFSPLYTLAVFLLRFFVLYGLAPIMNRCVACETTDFTEGYFFSAEGLLCKAHENGNLRITKEAAIAAEQYLAMNDTDNDPAVLHELVKMGAVMLRTHYEWKVMSLEV